MPPAAGRYLPNIEPATGQVFSYLPDSDAEDVARATAAAEAALPAWRRLPAEDRGRLLVRISELIERDLECLAQAESQDNGKPVSLARTMDIPRAPSNSHFFGTAAQHFASKIHFQEDVALNYTVRHPLGVVGCISPWNLPLYLFTWKIAPALVAGCAVVAKPSEITPYTAFLLSELCMEDGLPPGVLNIVHGTGPGAGQAIVEHPGIKAISFTGGTKTGEHIAHTAAPMFKKLSLELGGKKPNIIFADCDLAEAVRTSLRSSFSNQGQICLCGSRTFVERGIYEQFKADFLAGVATLTVADPQLETSRQGVLVSEAHLRKVLGHIALAHEEGGTLLAGGQRVREGGLEAAAVFHGSAEHHGEATARIMQIEWISRILDTYFQKAKRLAKWQAVLLSVSLMKRIEAVSKIREIHSIRIIRVTALRQRIHPSAGCGRQCFPAPAWQCGRRFR